MGRNCYKDITEDIVERITAKFATRSSPVVKDEDKPNTALLDQICRDLFKNKVRRPTYTADANAAVLISIICIVLYVLLPVRLLRPAECVQGMHHPRSRHSTSGLRSASDRRRRLRAQSARSITNKTTTISGRKRHVSGRAHRALPHRQLMLGPLKRRKRLRARPSELPLGSPMPHTPVLAMDD
jgi:hypothetical protein